MRSIGIDLHKRSLTVCVIDKNTGETFLRSFSCQDENKVRDFFKGQKPFEAVIEASASYDWLWELLDPHAERLVLAHPGKLRVIAESKKKSDRFDARTLSEFLARDEVPEAHRPTPHQKAYQHLVKHRVSMVRDRSRTKTKIRSILAARNLDRPDLFKTLDQDSLQKLKLSKEERFRVSELLICLDFLEARIKSAEEALNEFRRAAPAEERKNHSLVTSVPGAGNVVADVVISTLGNVDRFRSIGKVCSYAGLAPGFRKSDRKRQELGITKQGPRLLRWVLIEAAWRAVRHSTHWRDVFERISRRRGRKKAIVAVARRLLGVIYTLLKRGEAYVEDLSRRPTVRLSAVGT